MGHEIGTNRLPGGDAAGLKGLESALRLRPQHGLAAGPGDGDLAAATDIRGCCVHSIWEGGREFWGAERRR